MLHPSLARERAVVIGALSAAVARLRELLPQAGRSADIEVVHRFRVELRRARTVLRTLAGVVPAAELDACIEGCRWLAGRACALRDLDVFAAALPACVEESGVADAPALPLLLRRLAHARTRERRRLTAACATRRAAALLDRLDAIAALSPHAPGWPSLPALPAALRRAGRRVLKLGLPLVEAGATVDLHLLRKRCKRLRYLVEAHAPELPPRRVERVLGRLRKLQNALGQYQDCVTQSGLIDRLCAEPADGQPDCASLRAALQTLLALRIDAAARVSTERFRRLAENEGRRGLRRLRAPGARLERPWIGTGGYCHGDAAGAPIPLPVGKIVCIGRNYAAHAAELGNPVPETPLLFIKPPSAAVSFEPVIRIPAGQGSVHHELEIAVLIGRELSHATPEQARAAIAGIGLGIDLTLRDLQDTLKANSHPWEVAKGFDGAAALSGFAPLAAEQPLDNLELRLAVNGRRRQAGSSAQMLTPILALLCFASARFTLWPGDVVLTGTPKGVGALAPGNRLTAELVGVMRLRADVVA